MDTTNERLKELCLLANECSIDNLELVIAKAERNSSLYDDDDPFSNYVPIKPEFIEACIEYLKKNSAKVTYIVKKHQSDIVTMVYELALIVGPQLIENGKIKSMTIIVAVLMVIAKRGFDKVLSDSKDSPDDTSDEGKGMPDNLTR